MMMMLKAIKISMPKAYFKLQKTSPSFFKTISSYRILSKNQKEVPENIAEVNASVKVKFSPHRRRETSGSRLELKMQQPGAVMGIGAMNSQGAASKTASATSAQSVDSHVEVYDASSSISLSSVMQSSVPHPYDVKEQKGSTHLNMPGGQWAKDEKYLSGDLHENHFRNINKKNKELNCVLQLKSFFHSSSINHNEVKALTSSQKLKQAARDYGATVVVFHVAISLASLAFFYILVSSGLDLTTLFERLGVQVSNLDTAQEGIAPELPSSSLPENNLGQTELEDKTGKISQIVDSRSNQESNLPNQGSSLPNQGSNPPNQGFPQSEKESYQPNKGSNQFNNKGTHSQKVAVAAGVSTFVLAYAVHKVFAPVRIGITLTATPFIVRYLRKINILKTPVNK